MTTFGLEPIEGKVIAINQRIEEDHKSNCINLAGKIISEKELSFKVIRNAIMGIWENSQGVSISEVGRNKVLISFKDQRKGLQILKERPWSIRGQLVNLQMWNQRESIHEAYLNNNTARIIGDKIGITMKTKDPRSSNMLERSFLRVKVALDITRPLPTRFWLAREDLPNTWIEFKYERIQDSYCLKCGLLGHGRKDCQRLQAMAS
ncbi:hypothetical protein Ahy_B09g095678 [Arachis hypogaea]|uniref:CCHC-type domain-containing protein n=1 Tax=Arachis hypogaea TaxID=3818 RepID=A0A444XFM3_ARAHY|nr:hypothetical protein Ahy_B09g095678 [Arachis hypogaea]